MLLVPRVLKLSAGAPRFRQFRELASSFLIQEERHPPTPRIIPKRLHVEFAVIASFLKHAYCV